MHKFTKYGLVIEYEITSDNQLSVKVDGMTMLYPLADKNNPPNVGDGWITMTGFLWSVQFTVAVVVLMSFLLTTDFYLNNATIISLFLGLIALTGYYLIWKRKGLFERGSRITFKNKNITIVYKGEDERAYNELIDRIRVFA